MKVLEQQSWQKANTDYLLAHLERIRLLLQRKVAGGLEKAGAAPLPTIAHEEPATLDMLCAGFGLSGFERDILLLCAGVELDVEIATLCATAQGEATRPFPTFNLAFALFSETHWSAVTPDGPLRHWRLIEVEAGRSLMHSPLRLDEHIFHYLVGVPSPEKQFLGLLRPLTITAPLVPSHETLARELATLWRVALEDDEIPGVQFYGPDMGSQRNIGVLACAQLNRSVFLLPASLLPTQAGELENLLRLWKREQVLNGSALFLDCQDVERADKQRENCIGRVIEANKGLLIISTPEKRSFGQKLRLNYQVAKPTKSEQRLIWEAVLGENAPVLDEQIERLTGYFHLDIDAIQTACVAAQARLIAEAGERELTPENIGGALWEACRTQASPDLADLAHHITPAATWDDLIVSTGQRAVLRDIVVHVRQRMRVYETWGFRSKGTRGLGISALFVGASGVGKTMAAEVLAAELHLDLYRIDLSAVVSKYIGETEKNLRRIFDVAEGSGAILLFDEADALFGKRSEVKDSHDRYANIEVSYLLQRMEAYRGLTILTSNIKEALDVAFLRRIRFIVPFPFPGPCERAEIWRRVFPTQAPTADLDYHKLAQLNVAGGNIRNIALNAAFAAAEEGAPIGMQHILYAARQEYSKLEKPLTAAETRGWT